MRTSLAGALSILQIELTLVALDHDGLLRPIRILDGGRAFCRGHHRVKRQRVHEPAPPESDHCRGQEIDSLRHGMPPLKKWANTTSHDAMADTPHLDRIRQNPTAPSAR